MKTHQDDTATGRRRGFTLMEIMIAVALLAVSTAMAAAGFSRVIHTAVASVKNGVMHRELRNGLEMMSRDALEAKSIHSSGGNYIILVKPSPAGDFYVYYLVYNNALYRFTSNQPGSTILGRSFRTLNLGFFNLGGLPVTAPATAVLLNIRLDGSTTSGHKTYQDAVETRVRLRNKGI